MKRIFLSGLLMVAACFSFGQKNLTLLSNYPFAPGITCAGAWHYNDTSAHREYALVGTSLGLTIIDITKADSVKWIYDVPDTIGEWREVKVFSHYAYVSNEGQHGHGGGGILVIDLSNLPGTPVYKKYTGDGTIAGMLSSAHTVQVADSFLYINGTRKSTGQYFFNGGTVICSLSDPWNPVYVGAYKNGYVHDCFVRGNTLITSEIFANPGGFSIIDITNKSAPNPLSFHDTPFKFNHNTWMSDDSHFLYTTDELNLAPLASYDISDLLDPSGPLDTYLTNKNKVGEVHNVRVLNDFLVNSCYGDSAHTGSQVTIVDAAHPDNLIEVGDYQLCNPDTGFMISWDVDPYAASGNVIATEGLHGLFVLAPVYRRACYLEGLVTDSLTGFPINSAKVEILSTIALDSTQFTGNYKTGLADAGTYTVVFSKSGYITDTIKGVVLQNGVLTTLNVKLWNGITGMKGNAASNLFRIYPNPIHEDATIVFNTPLLLDNLHLRLTDQLGRIVKEITDIHESVVAFSREGIANGLYTLQLYNREAQVGEVMVVLQ